MFSWIVVAAELHSKTGSCELLQQKEWDTFRASVFSVSSVVKLYCMRKVAIIIAFAFLLPGISIQGQGKSLSDGSSGIHHCIPKHKAHSTRIDCLPPGTRLDDIVSYGHKARTNITVEKKLAQLKARCRKGKLVDGKGREIRFFRISCWGNPPDDYLDIQRRENEELHKLQKRYTVIVFECNPMIQ